MGNQLITQQFKALKKREVDESLVLTPESLLIADADYIIKLCDEVTSQLHVSDSDKFREYIGDNLAKPNEDPSGPRLADRYLADQESLIATGFKTPEALMEDLKNPVHVKHFNIHYLD